MKKYLILITALLSFNIYAQNSPKIYSVMDLDSGIYLEQENSSRIHSLASLTKLMTAYVLITEHPNLDNCFTKITDADKDMLKYTQTRIEKNEYISCKKLLQIMLVMSDNWTATALAKSLPGVSYVDFIKKMNQQASKWKMHTTYFKDASGISPENMSTAQDLNILIKKLLEVKEIKSLSSQKQLVFIKDNGQLEFYQNTNRIVREKNYAISLSKTGYIRESNFNLMLVPSKCKQGNVAIVILGALSSENRSHFAETLLKKYQCN